MSTIELPEDGDLVLYALHALPDAEMKAVSAQVAGRADLRNELGSIAFALGMYAEAAVPLENAPAASRERLMRAIAPRKAVLPFPARHPSEAVIARTKHTWNAMHWAGWAVAAALLIATGLQFRRGGTLTRAVANQEQQIQQANAQAAQLSRERDTLRAALESQARETDLSRSEAAALKDRSAELGAKVADQATRAERESARAGELASLASAAAQERDHLRGRLATQQDQVAQLSAQAASSRQITDALADPTALHVSMTVPKQKKLPTGRGTYVAGSGTLLFAASNMAPLHPGHIYELWLLPSDGGSPIPAGTFVPDSAGNATLISSSFRKAVAANGFAVTVEPDGGSQTPTMPILLAGSA